MNKMEWKIKLLPEEQKAGHWVIEEIKFSTGGNYTVHTCSECGIALVDPTYKNYCPNCGAKMDDEK